MAKPYITLEEGERLQQLWAVWAHAKLRTQDAIVCYGMSSETFRKADAEEGEIIRQIREIHGTADMHWMAS